MFRTDTLLVRKRQQEKSEETILVWWASLLSFEVDKDEELVLAERK